MRWYGAEGVGISVACGSRDVLVVDGVEGGEDGGLFFRKGGDVGDGVGVEGWKILICFCGLGHLEGGVVVSRAVGVGRFQYINKVGVGCIEWLSGLSMIVNCKCIRLMLASGYICYMVGG